MTERLLALVAQLEPDAVEVLEQIAARLVMGGRQYGTLKIDHDARDFRGEFAEEMLDGAVYAAIQTIRERRRAAAVSEAML